MTVRFAFDRSAREIDADGRLHVAKSHISKAVVNPYYGREVPGWQSMGLDPDKVYRFLRDPVELEKAASTFARLPILNGHIGVSADEPQKDRIVGAIGSDVAFTHPYLDADLCIWDSRAIAGIDTDKIRELSCSYRWVPVMESGEFEGDAYDGRMTEIRGNHLALVPEGRAGSDVLVADANPFPTNPKGQPAMKMTKLGKALFAALCAASPTLAADSALAALVSTATRKNFNPSDAKTKILAMDASLESEKLDSLIDAIIGVEDEPKAVELPKVQAAGDQSPAEKVRAMLEGKVESDVIDAIIALCSQPAADEEPGMKKEDVEKAMDSLRRDLKEAADAAREVRATVGDVLGMDSAGDIYKFALKHLAVDHAGIEDAAALRALYRVAATAKPSQPSVTLAHDSAGMVKRFPNANRFGI